MGRGDKQKEKQWQIIANHELTLDKLTCHLQQYTDLLAHVKRAMAALHYETSLRHNQQQTYPKVFQSCF